MVEDLKQYHSKWLLHVERMPPERLPRQATLCTPIGRR
jgi:hypothetical protein